MRVNKPLLTVVISWSNSRVAKQAQALAEKGLTRIGGSSKGMEITATPDTLIALGLAKARKASDVLGRVRSAGLETTAGREVNLPGFSLVEIQAPVSPRVAHSLATQLARNATSDLITVYDKAGQGHIKAAKAVWKGYETKPRTPKKSPIRVAKDMDSLGISESKVKSLITALQDLWDETQEQFAGALDTQDFENVTVRELVGDNAANQLSEENRKVWNGLESEAQSYLLSLAFPYDSGDTVRRLKHHFQNQSRGAALSEDSPTTLDAHYDPTDFSDTQDDSQLERFSSGVPINDLFGSGVEDSDEESFDPEPDVQVLMGHNTHD